MVAVHFIPNYNKQEGTGIFIYTPSMLDNKQLLSNMIDRKATQVIAKIFYQAIVDYSFWMASTIKFYKVYEYLVVP